MVHFYLCEKIKPDSNSNEDKKAVAYISVYGAFFWPLTAIYYLAEAAYKAIKRLWEV